MDQFTPKVLRDLYSLLPEQQKQEFLRLLGRISSPTVPLLIHSEMPKADQIDYSTRAAGVIVEMMMPLVIDCAWRVLKEYPEITRERFGEEVDAGMRTWVESMAADMRKLEREKLKAERDRQSKPETVKRNIEICDRRRQDSKVWTQGRLAKEYKLTPPAIRKILGDEAKWRRLAASG